MIATFGSESLHVDYTSVTSILNTPADFVRWAASRFAEAKLHFGHGTDNALDEAHYLVSAVLSLEPVLPPELMNTALLPDEKLRIAELVAKRIEKREPAAYLLNKAWFMGMPFFVDSRVLVPRSPMAELIENRFQPWLGDSESLSILDLCTGSGCIAIACAATFPHSRVWASDFSDDALAVATRNIAEHRLEDRISLVASDVYASLAGRRFDLIVSNPPYVAAKEWDALPGEYHAEPRQGLVAGRDGLEIVRRLLVGAAQHLNPGGQLVVEVGLRAEELEREYPELPFAWPEFTRGGEGVFVLGRTDLVTLAPAAAV